jgi:hypothetical protein
VRPVGSTGANGGPHSAWTAIVPDFGPVGPPRFPVAFPLRVVSAGAAWSAGWLGAGNRPTCEGAPVSKVPLTRDGLWRSLVSALDWGFIADGTCVYVHSRIFPG